MMHKLYSFITIYKYFQYIQGNSVARDLPPTGSEANTPPLISMPLFSLITLTKHEMRFVIFFTKPHPHHEIFFTKTPPPTIVFQTNVGNGIKREENMKRDLFLK